MFYKEFAIEPSQIKTIADLRWLEARFGYEKGALVSAFPGRWIRAVLESIKASNEEGELDVLTELLGDLKSKVLHRYSRNFNGESWVASAQLSHDEKPFHRIIQASQFEPPVWVDSLYKLGEHDFDIIPSCQRSSEAMANIAETLLVNAEKVILVDPYACPTKVGFNKTLLALMEKCNKEAIEFIVFSEEEGKPDWTLRIKALESLNKQLPQNITLAWASINDGGTGVIHPRALFTAKGGINYDRGFEEPRDNAQREEMNLLNLLSRSHLEDFAKKYNISQPLAPLELVQPVWRSK